jgi:hypothetical protein
MGVDCFDDGSALHCFIEILPVRPMVAPGLDLELQQLADALMILKKI